MFRTFAAHQVRKEQALSGKMWKFTALNGVRAGQEMKVMVPSCWETYPGYENYRGEAVYETVFTAGGSIRLVCKGVSHFAEVYIDDQKAAKHYGSYQPFCVYARSLADGEHKLRIKVDNSFKEEYSLDFPNDYMSYGGISRGVALEVIPDVHIQWTHVTPISETDGTWEVKVETSCMNISETVQQADIEIQMANKKVRFERQHIAAGSSAIMSKRVFIKDVTSWTMESPVLYEVKTHLFQDENLIDDLIDRFGFRLVKVKGIRVLLNGRPVRIKGFCRHEDHPQYGCALPVEAIAHDLQLIKDLGANSVRTTHYPNDECFLDMCDELGILVWEENHARGIEAERMKNPYFEPQCEQVIREMITEHYNHPSIIIWGILNECGSETEYGRTSYEAQYNLIRNLDASRPCSSASCKYDIDLCQDLLDISSWNMYPYWYDEGSAAEKLMHLYEWLQAEGRAPGKPFLVTEIGAGAIYGFRSRNADKWSEEDQAAVLKKQLEEVAAFENCTGMYIWQFCDIRVSREWALYRPRSRNNKGIVDEYRRPKLSYQTVREIYRSLPEYWGE